MCGVNITENKNSLHCIEIAAGYKLKLLDLFSYISIRGNLQQIFQWLLALSVICFHLSLNTFFSHSVYINSHSMFPHLRRPLDFRNM